ncbi:hypothetical protein AMTR_s05591p00003960 [Amborella trichopoda]|uniref:SWIM-type domain-containing protein n=1 Tax=Amborella trichopoda TaxID=13333 RepID=U5CUP3_AMBTC|nr:hypothetical protein AMTR_s05591p00003960 [Amborella trichopoda]
MAESFIAWILSAQEKSIITMCENIKIQLITRFEEKRELVIFAMDMQLEIHYLGKKYAIDLKHWTCNCRKWQFNGIPFAHVIAAINHMHLDPAVYCLKYFTVEYFKKAFKTPFAPVPDDIEFTSIYNRIVLPSRTTHLPGRPKKQRRISKTKHLITRPLKYKRCGAEGHNRRTCREPIE